MTDTDSRKPTISSAFVNNIKKYIEMDDALRNIREKTKELNNAKKNAEEYILTYMESELKEDEIGVQNDTFKRNVVKSQAPLKKEYIQEKLTEIVGDVNKATMMTEHLMKSRPTTERVTLRRVRSKK